MKDFKHKTWGHNIEVKTSGENEMSGFVWTTPSPRVGEEAMWCTEYGYAVGVFETAVWTHNVDDMYKVKIRIVERQDHFGNILWQED